MKRRLTFHLTGGSTLEATVDHADAEHLLGEWQKVQAGHGEALSTCQVSGMPVFHIAFGHVAAIVDTIA